MLSVGQIVEVEVCKVAVFGAFCRYEGQEVLILIPETSWIASYNSCLQFTEPGERLTVKIIHIDISTKKISASIREMYPNPWKSGLLAVGIEHQARVVRYVAEADRYNHNPGYLLELMPGSYAMMRANELSFAKNQNCTVTIIKSDISRHCVEVVIKENNS